MTAKAYLESIRTYKYQIAQYYLRIEEMYTILNANAIDYSRDRVQTSPSNKVEEVIAQIEELREKRLGKILEMEKYVDTAGEKIKQLGNNNYIEVLTERYVNLKRYESIAEQMHLENQTVRKLCMAGIIRFEEVHKQFLKSVNTNQH